MVPPNQPIVPSECAYLGSPAPAGVCCSTMPINGRGSEFDQPPRWGVNFLKKVPTLNTTHIFVHTTQHSYARTHANTRQRHKKNTTYNAKRNSLKCVRPATPFQKANKQLTNTAFSTSQCNTDRWCQAEGFCPLEILVLNII